MTAEAEQSRVLAPDERLRLRWSTVADADRVAQLVAQVFRESATAGADERTKRYARALFREAHPTLGPEDWAVVENIASGEIVACSCLMRNTWRYGTVTFPVGRPELVATDERYRRRGLMRSIFHWLHERSRQRGDLVQGITGIPYFYRQFGYEYAQGLPGGHRVYFADLPSPSPVESKEVELRPAVIEDAPALHTLVESNSRRWVVAAVTDTEYWCHRLSHPGDSDADWRIFTIWFSGEKVGFVGFRALRERSFAQVRLLELREEVNWRALTIPLLRTCQDIAKTLPVTRPMEAPVGVELFLGQTHPFLTVLGPSLLHHKPRAYAWYVRVADLPQFIQRIAPVLDARLAASSLAGYSGDLLV
ncbi:MAG: GNAT family N-acetyltransferase, partial [Chloroflexi bacterium]|nr:GNAT family N-acetyltransferase [Chloroflexota bacterium]